MPHAATLKVLLVDDQASVRQMTRITLSELGVRLVHESDNGQDALFKAMSQPLDLIISDFNMPGMDGIGLLRAVRSNPSIRKTPFILITGRGDRELVVTAAQAGVNNYIVKPFNEKVLRQKMEEVLGKIQ